MFVLLEETIKSATTAIRYGSRINLHFLAWILFGVVITVVSGSLDLGLKTLQHQAQTQTSTSTQRYKNPTKLTGFGSQSPLRSSILLHPSSSNTTESPTQLWIQRQDESLLFRSRQPNSTFVHLSLKHDGKWNLWTHEEKETNSSAWVPVEGIFGVYLVPSGIIWVFISSSTTVLSAEPWGQICKIKALEMIHLSSSSAAAVAAAPTTAEISSSTSSVQNNCNIILSQRQAKEQHRQLQLLRQALKGHELYYAKGGITDMTHTLQRALGRQSKLENETLLDGKQRPDSRFFWNEPLIEPILHYERSLNDENDNKNNDTTISATEVLLQHCIPVTSAFVGIQRKVSATDRLTYDEVLISRRSRFRAGTRFTKRGADSTGNVANYAETEQICLIGNNTLMSHVQIRGSIPLWWSSPADVKTYRPRVRIGTDPIAQARALQNHLLSEWNHYVLMDSQASGATTTTTTTSTTEPRLVLLNLIDKTKDQGRLGRAFDAVLQAVLDAHTKLSNNKNGITNHSVKHIWFDFHAEVKGGRWHRLKRLLTKISPTLAEHGYFKASRSDHGNKNAWKIQRLQNGVVRTNCMDCLDRTNVVQSIIGRYALFNELAGMTTSTPPYNSKLLPPEMSDAFRTQAMTLPWESGEVTHRSLWADNADAISRLYAGTPALKRDFTRTGKRTKFGALDDGFNSLQRYYLNNFLDADRQEGVDLMTGYASFSVLRDGDEPQDETRSKYSSWEEANLSLAQAARMLSDKRHSESDGNGLYEASFVHIKRHRRNILSQIGGPTLDLRWLPGDLQSHMKGSANAAELQSLDHRTALDTPWWVIDETSVDIDDSDSSRDIQTPPNIGHVLAGLIAVMQAPVSTAATILLILGWTYRKSSES